MIELVVLGSGSAIPTRERNHPAIWMRYMGETFLLDCGEGTQRQMVLAGLSYAKVDNVLVTHWHADHALGLVGLLRTMEMESVERGVRVVGPDVQENLQSIMDFTGQLEGLEIQSLDVPKGGGVMVDTPYYKISAYPTLHNVRSYGYVFEEKDRWHIDMDKVEKVNLPLNMLEELRQKLAIKHGGRILAIGEVAEKIPGKKIVYTGDTLPTENTTNAAKNADLLIHDATFASEQDRKEKSHSTAEDAARIAKEAGVKQLMLIHFSKMYNDAKAHLEAAKVIFPNTLAAEDLMALKIT